MALPDYTFTEGFDKYGPAGEINILTNLVKNEWTTTGSFGGAGSVTLIAALGGTGQAIQMVSSGSGSGGLIRKTLPGNFARIIGGVTFNCDLATKTWGFTIGDTATDQVTITVDVTTGTFSAKRGGPGGTNLGTSAQSVSANTTHCLEWDITINNTTGIVKIWLDGVATSVALTGQNTRASANNYANYFCFQPVSASGQGIMSVDHFYLWCYTSAGGSETPALTNPIIETQFPNSDSAVAFTKMAGVLGQAYRTTASTNAPGANQIVLKKYTPPANCTINSISFLPQATSAGAKWKAVVYGDTAGAPGTLLSSGNEVVGLTSGTISTGTLVTPQALTGGTQYWIGYITDTSVVISQVDATTVGYKAANTYTSGAPGTAPAMTSGQVNWMIYGNCTGLGANWPQVDENPPLGDLSYNQSSTVSQEDLYGFPALVSTPTTIYSVAVKASVAKSDAGARTVDLETKSGSTTSSGSAPGQAPATTYGWLSSYFNTDPNTGSAWGAAGLNSATGGIKIAS